MFNFFSIGPLPSVIDSWQWTNGPSDVSEHTNAVIAAARAYADFTHGNLTGARYKARQEARDALLDALEAFDEAMA